MRLDYNVLVKYPQKEYLYGMKDYEGKTIQNYNNTKFMYL